MITAKLETNPQIDIRFRELMTEYERPLYSYVLSLVRDRDLASDCLQDTFVRAYEALRAGKAINRQWLFTVARNRAIDEFRHRRKLRPEGGAVARGAVEESVDQRVIVRQILDRLPALDRDVLYLFTVVGFKTDEIARMAGTSGGAIRQRLYRARSQFRAHYVAESSIP
jgi:RNA polymerase sigma-70 factor (ECF subfamily)